MNVRGLTHEELVVAVRKNMHLLIEKFGLTRDYGYFTAFDCESNLGVLFVIQINHCPPGKADKHFSLSVENARRLFSLLPDHETSFQSLDLDEDKTAGAVRAGNIILSFSGFAEDITNEALMILTAHDVGWFDSVKVQSISAISDNPYIRQIFQ
ncbi:MAG: hypothetical protein NTW11_03000 [Candidatus Staskawiczbacteria bacterium]|nr:hypothetical protein [Candidatus Staskawiczbacteria bacterium]